jgi:glycosyltransferase involved in cell wall biosynthesis
MPDSGAHSAVSPLKILMTADAVGGVWQYSRDLISHVTTRGAQVLLATMGPRPTDAQRRQLAALAGAVVCESDYKLEWMQRPWSDVDAAGAWLLDLAAQFQPDIVHLNGYVHAALPWNAPTVVVAHSCVYSWWHAVHGSAPPEDEWAEYHHRVSAGLRAADAVVAPSAFMAEALTAHYGLRAGHAQVIHNFSESPAYNGTAKEPFFIAAGRIWDSGKNLKLLEDIAARLRWPVRVAGSAPHDTLLADMQRASVYVHPALYEPFGLAVLEAARAECCLVLADIPSLRELWDGAAIFVDPREPDRWVQALNAVATNEAARQSFGRLARLQARQYSSADSMDKYWQIYQSLTRARKCGSPEGAAA